MGQYFGTSQNRIEDKQIGTEGVIVRKILNWAFNYFGLGWLGY